MSIRTQDDTTPSTTNSSHHLVNSNIPAMNKSREYWNHVLKDLSCHFLTWLLCRICLFHSFCSLFPEINEITENFLFNEVASMWTFFEITGHPVQLSQPFPGWVGEGSRVPLPSSPFSSTLPPGQGRGTLPPLPHSPCSGQLR